MKKIILILIILITAFLLLGCTQVDETNNGSGEKIEVMASFYPFYDIVKNIAGDKANVSVLVPPGSEPHSFNPSPQDILKVSKSDIFIVTGTDFEDWEERIVENVNNNAIIVKANNGIDLLLVDQKHSHEEEHSEEIDHNDELEHDDHATKHSEEEHSHGLYDPHFWVSPINTLKIIDNLTNELINVDPKNLDYYLVNSIEYKNKIMDLHDDFKTGLANCEKGEIITTHAAFAYLGEEYGFDQITILGLSPNSEPTASQIINILNEAKHHGLKYIFYEELVDLRVSETIASEANASVLVLNPVAGSKSGKSYIEIMEQNLTNLKIGLECK